MKICWDNIEKLKLTKYGNFFDGKRLYVEKDECKNCKESFLSRKDNKAWYRLSRGVFVIFAV